MAPKKFYITTPLYYVNSKPHIGHSYTEIACDCLARYRRMRGDDVLFLTGTDEHGQKVQRSAEAEGKETMEFIDSVVKRFQGLWQELDISYDDFIRTTEQRHKKAVQAALATLYKSGDIYQDEYKGYYCTPCETFWSRLQAQGNLCPDCKRPVEEIVETNYFFRLSKYQGWLSSYIKEHDGFIKPDFRKNEVLGCLAEPINDLCISRPRQRLTWGIDIPFSKEHVTYVWFDALLNYISACGWPDDTDKFKSCWPADVHMIGKDILRPHAVYWPIILHALGIEPPKSIFAHGWWLISGEKMSKSKGNIIDPQAIIDKYGADAYRYFLLREVTFGLDGTFSEEAFISRFNSDLANDLGNLLNRTLTMVEKYFAGAVPDAGESTADDRALQERLLALPDKVGRSIDGLNFSQALSYIWEVVNIANKHIEVSAPWQLAKDNKIQRLESVIYTLLKVLCSVVFLIYPFMPRAAKEMARQLGVDMSDSDFRIERLSGGILKPNGKVRKGNPIFPRIL